MIGHGDHDGINIGPRQQVAKIVAGFAILIVVMFIDYTHQVMEVILVHIARGNDPAIRMGQKRICIAGALAAGADDPHDDLLGRGFAICGATGNEVRQNQSGAASQEKAPPADGCSNDGRNH
jgi:hypothetical protein